MEKTATMNLRVNPVVKQRAEEVLRELGIPMATAIDMYLRQIGLTGSIPFAVRLPASVNADEMSTAQLHAALEDGYVQGLEGKTCPAAEAILKQAQCRTEKA